MKVRTRTLLAVAVVESALIAGLVLGFRYYLHDFYDLEAKQFAQITATTTRDALRNAVLSLDADTATRTAQELVRRHYIDEIRVYHEQKLLAQANVVRGKRPRAATPYGAVSPITVAGRDIGRVEVDVSPVYVSHRLDVATFQSAAIGLLALGISLVLAYVLSRYLTDPLTQLRDAARAIARGNLGTRVPVRGSDEIGETAAAFNEMTASLLRANYGRQQAESEIEHIRLQIDERIRRRAQQMAASRASFEQELLYDRVTGLPTRLLLFDRIRETRKHRPDATLALLLLDILDFESVNHGYGRLAGDQLLQHVAQKLRALLHENVTLARPGPDEFAVLVDAAQHEPEALASRLLAELENLMELGGRGYRPSLRAAIATTRDCADPDALLDGAYRSLANDPKGRIVHATCQPDGWGSTIRAEDIMEAISRHAFVLYYQARIDPKTRRLTGLQVTTHWNHPVRGLVDPDEFLPLARQYGLQRAITRFTLDMALRQKAGKALAVAAEIPVCVAADESSIQSTDFPNEVRGLLERAGADPTALEISVPWQAALANPIQVMFVMQSLRGLGVRVAIEDFFGIEYSCLAYLNRDRQLVNSIRLDRSLIQEVMRNSVLRETVNATVTFARKAGIQVVAEGIENDKMYAYSQVLHCDAAQGYYIHRPVMDVDLDETLKDDASLRSLPSDGNKKPRHNN